MLNQFRQRFMQEKVVIVTGASSGIGRATASVFAEAGATVVAVGRNERELNDLAGSVTSKEGTIKSHLADVTEPTQLDRLVNETVDDLGRIDVLINSAG